MSVNVRELRLAIQKKLEERRHLLTETKNLREAKYRAERERDAALDVMRSPLAHALMEGMADEIANRIISEALRASEVIARETFGEGSYEIGIDIPPLRIRHLLDKREMQLYRDYNPDWNVRRISYRADAPAS